MSGKNLVLELNAKMLLANQIAGFLNFNISKTIGGINLIFFDAGAYLLKLQIDDVILLEGGGEGRSDMSKEAFKTVRSQKLNEIKS